MRRGTQEAAWLAACFAATSVVPFLPPQGKARLVAAGLGMPPLLLLALTAVSGCAAVWSLRREGFFARASGLGIGRAVKWASALSVLAVVADLAALSPHAVPMDWPAPSLVFPALAVVHFCAFGLVPAAVAQLLTRRARISIALAALVAPALSIAQAIAQGIALPPWTFGATAALDFAVAAGGLLLLRRHGIAAPLAFALTHTLWWQIVWGAIRPLLFTGP